MMMLTQQPKALYPDYLITLQSNGKKYYSHSTWLSHEQIRSLSNNQTENNNLALYTGAGLFVSQILFLRSLRAILKINFKTFTIGVGVGFYLNYYLCSLFFYENIEDVANNIHLHKRANLFTPYWNTPEQVHNLRNVEEHLLVVRRKRLPLDITYLQRFKPSAIFDRSYGKQQILQLIS